MTTSLVRSFIDAINAQQWDRLEEFVSPDVVRHGQLGQPPRRGLEDFRRFLIGEAATFPDAHEEIEFLVDGGDHIAARIRFQGTQLGPLGPYPPSGRKLTACFLTIWRMQDARIAEIWAVWDNLEALVKLGHICLDT